MEVRTDEPSEVKDDTGAVDRRGTVGGAQIRVNDETVSTVDAPFGVIDTGTGTTTFELQMGVNLLMIEPVDPGALPGSLRYDPGWQLGSITIGADEPDLKGGIGAAPAEPTFKRGDADAVGSINITDGIFLLQSLFGGAQQPACRDSADANDDGSLNITDAVYVFSFLFVGGALLPPDPGTTTCGVDTTDDALDCVDYDNC